MRKLNVILKQSQEIPRQCTSMEMIIFHEQIT